MDSEQERINEDKSGMLVDETGPGDVQLNPVPPGVTSFADLIALKRQKKSVVAVGEMSKAFPGLLMNIAIDGEIANKEEAVVKLANEFVGLVQDQMSTKEQWQPLTDKIVTKLDELKQKPMKTEGGVKFPSSDFAFVPDPEKPSTWKLRLAEDRPGNVTRSQLGAAAAAFSPGGFRGKRVQIPSDKVASVKAKIKAAYKKLGVRDEDIPTSIKERSEFSVWKEAGDTYRWLAIYSNNYRDDDNPPEILSKEAHIDFVRACDEGEWPLPELWFWHVKGSCFGKTDLVAYDEETGMSLAMGTMENKTVAEKLAQRNDIAVSHGMPPTEIQRDPDDATIITRYRSQEISVLPYVAAANKLTRFVALNKEDGSMIPDNKREEMEKVGFDVEQIQAKMEAAKAQAVEEERDSKEVTDEVEVVVEVVEEVTEMPEQVDEVVETPEQPLTVEMISNALRDAMQPLADRIEALEQKTVEQPEDKEVEDVTSPGDSLAAYLKASIVGKEVARVDGRKARHDGPKENKDKGGDGGDILASKNPLANTIVNQIIDPTGAWIEDLPVERQQ